jgi:mannose-6-phosphate isomerase-like protein (cupin superfamily)
MTTTVVNVVNLAAKLGSFTEHWSPKIVGEVNGQHVKVTKMQGEFVWHSHANEDELFLVVKGRLVMQLRDKTLTINPGEFVVIPRGVEHCPTSDEEVHIVLIEPAGILHSGGVEDPRAVADYERI